LNGPSDQAIERKAPRRITRSGVLDVSFEANQEVATTVRLWPVTAVDAYPPNVCAPSEAVCGSAAINGSWYVLASGQPMI